MYEDKITLYGVIIAFYISLGDLRARFEMIIEMPFSQIMQNEIKSDITICS